MSGRLGAGIRWLARAAVAAVLLAIGRGGGEKRTRELPATQGRERLVLALLGLTILGAAGFIAAYASGADTQLLGISMGAALGSFGAAAIVASRALVPQEEQTEQRPRFAYPQTPGAAKAEQAEADGVARDVARAGEGITRRRLLTAVGGTAGLALGAAAASPLASLGPGVSDTLFDSPWRDGVRLVDENALPLHADDLGQGGFLTAFAEGSDPHRQIAAAVVVVRVDPAKLELPQDRSGWAPQGLLAFSKVCTHAGCAVNLFRSPQFPAKEPGPALVCPCHYSTFDVLKGGERVFGPAGRPLPQLPLRVDADGDLVAAGPLSGAVGPSWRGVRQS